MDVMLQRKSNRTAGDKGQNAQNAKKPAFVFELSESEDCVEKVCPADKNDPNPEKELSVLAKDAECSEFVKRIVSPAPWENKAVNKTGNQKEHTKRFSENKIFEFFHVELP